MTSTNGIRVPLFIGALFVALAVGLWHMLDARERAGLDARVAVAAQDLSLVVRQALDDRTRALDRMAGRWESRGGTPRAEWEADAARHITDQPGYRAIEWVDRSFHVRWIVPRAGNEQAEGLDLASEPRRRAALEEARDTRTVALTRAVDLVQGGKGFLAFVPVYTQDTFEGFILGVFKVDGLLETIAAQAPDYRLQVFDGAQRIYGTDDAEVLPASADSMLLYHGLEWHLHVAATKAFAERLLSPLPEVVLGSVLMIALLAGIGTALALSARRRERAHRDSEARLAEREALLARAERMAGLGSWELDFVTQRVVWSDQSFRTLGVDPATFDGRQETFMERVHPEDRARVQQHIDEIMEKGIAYDLEFRIVRATDGETRHVHARGEITHDQSGRPALVAGTTLDITERVRAREAIADRERKLRLITNNVPALIAHVDRDRRYTFANEEYHRWAGCDVVVGRTIDEVLGDRQGPAVMADVERVFAGERVDRQRKYAVAGVDREFRVSLVPDRDAAGDVLGIYVFAVDISELHALTERLERSNKELESFAYVASHDLQEPLRMVESFCELLARRYGDQLDADANEFIGFAVDGARRMRALITDLLDYSRAQRREFIFEETDLRRVVDDAIANLKAAIDESGATIEIGPLPVIAGDGSQLTRLFANLIGNAIKFVGARAPVVTVSAEEMDGGWEIAVADNGIGIKPEHRERIFGIFQRLHAQNEYAGTGIGLTISRQIALRHGGDIRVESTPGEGTTFFVRLRAVAPGVSPAPGNARTQDAKGLAA